MSKFVNRQADRSIASGTVSRFFVSVILALAVSSVLVTASVWAAL